MGAAQEDTLSGIVITTSDTAYTHAPEVIYDFVTNPANWTKTYPGSSYVGRLENLPLQVGDTWEEGGPDSDRIFTWQLAMAVRPRRWVFTSVGRLGHDRDGNGVMDGRITVEYEFTRPGADITLFRRTMTIEAPKDAPMPDGFFRIVNPANIDRYHAAVARELDALCVTA
ncbi:SRPBCC family protein [Mycolicibacterium monacense]|uniref:SRPBCC family protein n=1 Tax=Mycolicibacterium monacense TaxID=85693 RepID=UPI0007E929E2|nr:SRPBCC family protein [Mycolicibacterium monacense]OBF51529.1 polyketide cyclase [Mycolicibacterium monacense]